MGTTRRHCKRCKRETPHDVYKTDGAEPRIHPLERVFLGIVTVEAFELSLDTVAKCQRCGKTTEI